MNLALKLKIFFFYRYVGQDEFGNKIKYILDGGRSKLT